VGTVIEHFPDRRNVRAEGVGAEFKRIFKCGGFCLGHDSVLGVQDESGRMMTAEKAAQYITQPIIEGRK